MRTGAEYRHGNKLRQQKYRAEMKEKGYTATAIYMNDNTKDRLKEISKEKKLPQYLAIEWAIEQALGMLSSISSVKEQSQSLPHDTPQKIIPPKEYPNRQALLFEEEPEDIPDTNIDDLPDCHGKDLTTEKRQGYLLQVQEMFPFDDGPKKPINQKRADALNAAGITTRAGKTWDQKAVNDNLLHINRKLKKQSETPQNAVELPFDENQVQTPTEKPNVDKKPIPDIHEEQKSDIDTMPELGTDAYTDWLFDRITDLRAEGMGWKDIMERLNSEGILTLRGKPWGRGNVDGFYKRETKKREN